MDRVRTRGGPVRDAVVLVLGWLRAALCLAAVLGAGHSARAAATYANPVLSANAADPDVIHGLDGYYYLYATSTRFNGTGPEHIFPIWRSTDLVHWSYVSDAFSAAPDWAGPASGLWAPDVHYLNGQYHLYYTADQANALPA